MVIRESKNVFLYQPGKSLLTVNSFSFNTPKASLVQRVGYYTNYNNGAYSAPYDPKNGIFFEATGTTLNICKANNTTVTKIAQSAWNGYKFQGAAPYNITLDVSKVQIFWIDIQWLGSGTVRTGFIIDGTAIIAHSFHHANSSPTTYMQTACLPVRYEIINIVGGTSTGGAMNQICSSVMSEGGYESTTIITFANTGIAPKAITIGNSLAYQPLISIRLTSGKFDAIVIPSSLSVILTSGDNVMCSIFLNATITGGSWTTVSNVDYNTTQTSFSGGTSIYDTYVAGNGVLSLTNGHTFGLQLGKYFDSTSATSYVSDTLTVAIVLISISQSAYNVASILGWQDTIK
jgi:hypothetical protein